MNINDRYNELRATLPEKDKEFSFNLSLRQYGIDRMVSENDFTTIENGIKRMFSNMYDEGVLSTKPTMVIAGYGDSPHGKEFCVFTYFGK